MISSSRETPQCRHMAEESEKSLFNTFEGSFVNREIGKGVDT